MKKIAYLIASSVSVFSLMMAIPLVAIAHESEDASAHADARLGLSIGAVNSFFNHQNKSEGEKETNDNATHEKHNRNASSTGAVGTVSNVNGSTFTLTNKHGTTTTVTTNASTTYQFNGATTTSGAIAIGAHAFVLGTRTSTTTLSASFVSIWDGSVKFFKHFFR